MQPTWVPGFPGQKCLASLGGHFWRLIQPAVGQVLALIGLSGPPRGTTYRPMADSFWGMPGGRIAKAIRGEAAEPRSEPAGAQPPRGGDYPSLFLDPAVRRDSVRYRKVKELSRIKDLLSLCFPWQKFGRWFPLPRGLVPETTRDGFPKPRHQRFLIPRAFPAPGWAVAGS